MNLPITQMTCIMSSHVATITYISEPTMYIIPILYNLSSNKMSCSPSMTPAHWLVAVLKQIGAVCMLNLIQTFSNVTS
jgi:hypothetical protein